jgi:hypothetical protein
MTGDDARYMLADAKLKELLMKELHGTYEPEPLGALAEEAEPFTGEELKIFDRITFIKYSELLKEFDIDVVGITNDKDYVFSDSACILMPYSAMDEEIRKAADRLQSAAVFARPDPAHRCTHVPEQPDDRPLDRQG